MFFHFIFRRMSKDSVMSLNTANKITNKRLQLTDQNTVGSFYSSNFRRYEQSFQSVIFNLLSLFVISKCLSL